MGVCSSPPDCGVGRDVGEERHFVPASDELLCQEGNDPFRSAVQRGWHRLHQWGQNGDPHCPVLLRDPSIGVGQVSRRGLEPRILPNALCRWQQTGLTGGSEYWLHNSCPVRSPLAPAVLPSLPVFTRSLSFDGLVGGIVTRRYTSGKLFRDAEGASYGAND